MSGELGNRNSTRIRNTDGKLRRHYCLMMGHSEVMLCRLRSPPTAAGVSNSLAFNSRITSTILTYRTLLTFKPLQPQNSDNVQRTPNHDTVPNHHRANMQLQDTISRAQTPMETRIVNK